MDIHCPTTFTKLVQGLMWAPPGAETVGEIVEVLFVDLLQEHADGTLHDLVFKSRFADRTLAAIFFLQPGSLHRRCSVPPASQPIMQVTQVRVEVDGILCCRDPVAARGARLAGPPMGLTQQVLVDQMRQGRERGLWIADRLLRNPLKFR